MDTPKQKPVIRSKEEIQQLIEQWKASRKTKIAFCRERDISYPTFIGWTRGKKKNTSAFIPLQINSPQIFAEVILRNGTKIIFHAALSAQELKTLLR